MAETLADQNKVGLITGGFSCAPAHALWLLDDRVVGATWEKGRGAEEEMPPELRASAVQLSAQISVNILTTGVATAWQSVS